MTPADEIYVWMSTDDKGNEGVMVMVEKNSGFEGALVSANLAVACTWKPLADKVAEVSGHKCVLVRYERREEIPPEMVEQTIEFASNDDGKTEAPH